MHWNEYYYASRPNTMTWKKNQLFLWRFLLLILLVNPLFKNSDFKKKKIETLR